MSIFERYRNNKTANKHEEVVKYSQNLYQLREYNGEIWLTYDGHLICPGSMLKEEPVKAVTDIRKLYVDRTPKLSRI